MGDFIKTRRQVFPEILTHSQPGLRWVTQTVAGRTAGQLKKISHSHEGLTGSGFLEGDEERSWNGLPHFLEIGRSKLFYQEPVVRNR